MEASCLQGTVTRRVSSLVFNWPHAFPDPLNPIGSSALPRQGRSTSYSTAGRRQMLVPCTAIGTAALYRTSALRSHERLRVGRHRNADRTHLGVLIGIILAQHVPGWRPIRTLLFLPFLISGAALATVFAMVYNPRYGLLNEVVTWLGLPARDWLAQTDNCARRGDCHLRVHHRLSGRSRDG